MAWRAAPALAALIPQATTIPGLDRVGLNLWVLLFSLAASMGSALIFSAVACIGLTREGARGALSGQRRVTMSAGARRAASSLVAAEIALAVVLLVGAGLTLRSFAALIAVDPGFSPDRVLTMQIGLPAGRYGEQPARSAAYQRIFSSLDALPEVETVGAAAVTPLTGNNWTAPLVRPEHPLAPGQRPPEVGWQSASAGYFRALKIPLRDGRLFEPTDTMTSPPVVIVSDSIAERYFPGENPIGKRSSTRRWDGGNRRPRRRHPSRLVVRCAARRSLLSVRAAERQRRDAVHPDRGRSAACAAGGSQRGPAVEPNAVLFETRTLVRHRRGLGRGLAAGNASARGLCDHCARARGRRHLRRHVVQRAATHARARTRLALGASRADILTLVMRQAVVISAIGLFIGIATGLAAARALSSLLYGVPPWDPLALAGAGLVLTITALGASYLPARRAALVDPACTLTTE